MNKAKANRKSSQNPAKPRKAFAAIKTGQPELAGSDFAPVFFAIILGLGFLTLLDLSIAKWYHPDTSHIIKEGAELFTPEVVKSLAPEPVERLQYVAGVFLVPLFLLGCLFVLKGIYRRASEPNQKRFKLLATVLLLAATVATPFFTYQSLKHCEFSFIYVGAGLMFTDWATYAWLFLGLALLAYFVHERWVWWTGRIALYLMSAYMAAVVFFMVLFDLDSIQYWAYHLNAVIYPLAQVMAGKTLLVDCIPLYGMYPHFLQPLFVLIPLSVYSFTVVMGFLLLICLASLWLFLRSMVKNDFVFLAGFLAAVFYSYAGTKILLSQVRPEPYFQYAPIRMLFPCLLLALSAAYLRGIGKWWIYRATFPCSALATLWNMDSGLVVFGAWCLLMGYVEMFRNPWRMAIKPILRHALAALASLLLVYGGYALFVFFRAGAWPDWVAAAKYLKIFSYYGLCMMPMGAFPHFWCVVVIVYVIAMTVAIRELLRKGNESFGGSLFLLAVLGAGLFSYYNGRSHDYCLIPLLYIPIIIVALLTDHVLICVKAGDKAGHKFLPLAAMCFFFCASAVPSVFAQSGVFLKWIHEGAGASARGSRGIHSKNIEFIRNHVKPGERIFILLGAPGSDQWHVEGLYYAESSTGSVLNLPDSDSWCFKAEIDQVLRFLDANRDVKVFTVPAMYTELQDLFAKRYSVVAQESQTGLTMLLPQAGADNKAAAK